MHPLSTTEPTTLLPLGDTVLRYSLEGASGHVEFLPVPAALVHRCVAGDANRPFHPSQSSASGLAWNGLEKDPLVQTHLRGDAHPGGWVAGHSLRNSPSTMALRFERQEITRDGHVLGIRTILASAAGLRATHTVRHREGAAGFFVETALTNAGAEPVEIEMLSSFSVAGISPFVPDDAPGRLFLHRFRSAWSNEGRHCVESFENLHLERNWGGKPNGLVFGQTGSMPVRGFHPFVAIEDRAEGVFWGAQIAWHGSWQIEVTRRDDAVAFSGGHGDFNRAHWMKRLAPGESFAGPTALVACVRGNIESLCHALLDLQEEMAAPEPEHERDLPIIFNEWCSTWGNPNHDYLVRTADRLATTPTRHLVIDDGWAEKPPGEAIQFNGDWNVNTAAFPSGLAATADAIRQRGLIPGLWFEFETCTRGSDAYNLHAHQLHLHGRVLQIGNRHFWDFRDPWTIGFLTEKVIRRLREGGFGYLKVDYNESLGIGCDGSESPGEALRQHLDAVRRFFEKIRAEVPGIVIENCSSGGHRAEPGFVSLTSLTSVSDAHETVEIPIISAQLQRLVPARKLQVWAVLRPEDSAQRLRYSLAATFLGRMCVSGDVVTMDDARFAILREAQEFYTDAVPAIRDGRSRLLDATGPSRKYPTGWQAVVRSAGSRTLVVFHSFEGGRPEGSIRIPIPCGRNGLATFGAPAGTEVRDHEIAIPPVPDFTGCAWLIS